VMLFVPMIQDVKEARPQYWGYHICLPNIGHMVCFCWIAKKDG
jgi:hypothetical protein